jgi:hypothetical protein
MQIMPLTTSGMSVDAMRPRKAQPSITGIWQ